MVRGADAMATATRAAKQRSFANILLTKKENELEIKIL